MLDDISIFVSSSRGHPLRPGLKLNSLIWSERYKYPPWSPPSFFRKSEIIHSHLESEHSPLLRDKKYDWTTTRRHVENRTEVNREDISSFWIFTAREAKFLRYIAKFIKLRRVAAIDINNYKDTWVAQGEGGGGSSMLKNEFEGRLRIGWIFNFGYVCLCDKFGHTDGKEDAFKHW